MLTGVNQQAELVMLVTVRVRYDPDFPNDRFITIRRYVTPGASESETTLELTDIDVATAEIRRWMKEAPELWP
jgi:hypothetical protein